jgi:hypothetical protein
MCTGAEGKAGARYGARKVRRFLLHYHDGSVPPPLPRSSIFARFVETPQRIIYKGLSDKKASKKLFIFVFQRTGRKDWSKSKEALSGLLR